MISQNEKDNIKKYWKNLYECYHLSLDQNLKSETKEWRLKHIRGFIDYLISHKIKCNNLKPTDVYNYLSKLVDYSPRTREYRAVCIRFFLDYLNFNKKIKFSGRLILPKIHCNKESKIISYYSDDEINKILNVINAEKQNGKLDLVMMSLLVYYGIRTKDIVNLKIDDIDWKNNYIIINQSKNNYLNILPLIDDVKYSILDYLKNERGTHDENYLLIKNNHIKINEGYVYNKVNYYFKLANIKTENKRHGSHSLRHSLGTSMINHGENIYSISKILGHSNINDTKIYSKLDLNKLKIVSLEVPKWED